MTHLDNLILRCDPRYVKKIKKMVDLCTRTNKENDALLIIEGREGTGKTNAAEVTAGIFKALCGREALMYFNLNQLISHAQNHVGMIYIWDEPSLDSLTTDQLNELNKDLMRLLMTCRVNRHFFIFNITDFTKFSRYITIERPVGFVHLQKLRTGHGCYIRYTRLESLWQHWNDYHKRAYRKYKKFWLDFPLLDDQEWLELDLTINNIAHATREEYTKQKRMAISNIGNKKENKNKLKRELRQLKKLIATEPKGIKTLEERARHYKVNERQLQRWSKLDLTSDFDSDEGDVAVFKAGDDADIVNIRERWERVPGQPPIPKGADLSGL